ncbi:S8 family peptidase [Polluticoccus soli]|uniref:S8 family peptidase n=1 Tax=Polluticoccus soli TaxID=3034150 RepID=UPI0023E13BF9|nr:S8 family peptidase [Flavipsychrobacter sp. JY13-12]
MRWWGSLLCLLVCVQSEILFAQPQYAFRVSFTDKQGSPPVSNPQAFLSQRSIDRRTAQGLSVDSTDRPVSTDYIDSVLTITGGILHLTSRWLNHCVVLTNDSTDILLLNGKPYIAALKHIATYPTGLHNRQTGKGKFDSETELSGLAKTSASPAFYGTTYNQTHTVNGDHLHNYGFRGEGKLIAVLDEGFSWVNTNRAFDYMRNSGRLVDKRNFVYDSDSVYGYSSHGTSSLSTIAAYVPDTFVGAAPDAQYALYITEYALEEQEIELDNMLAATERADSIGADIVTESLGYNLYTNPFYYPFVYADIDGKSSVAAKAANLAVSKGMIFVASAGNEGGGGWNYILTPGDADSAITVGSVNEFKVPATNSGFGPNASGRRKPDVCMVGNPAAVLSTGVNANFINGTSFATPQLAGWAACLWQSSPSRNAYQIKRAIVESAHAYTTPDNHLGYGVPDFKKAQELLGIKGPALSSDNWLAVWPNPFTKDLTVKLYHDSGEVELLLTAMDGRKILLEKRVLHTSTHYLTIETPQLPVGVYFLTVTDADRKHTVRLEKN